jgi:hypothetical protein
MLQVTNVHSKVITTILTSLLLVCNFGHSSVVAGTAVRIQGANYQQWDNNYEIHVHVDQTIKGDDYTVALFSADSANSAITLRAISMDEGSSWYLASYGQTFSQISLPNFSRILFNEPIQLYDAVFYLAINTRSGFYPAAQEVFGWAKFGLSANNNLTLIDSAIDYGDRGIIVGTYQSVPEPSSLSLLALGGVVVALCRRKRA